MSGLSVIGRDYYGVFPLRGKLLNVRDATHASIMKNEEIKCLMDIIGLKPGVVYDESNIKTLRYGRLMIMADQDHDGSHIKGLVINFIHHFWKSLLDVDGFLKQFITPIVKATKGSNTRTFFTLPEVEAFKESPESKGYSYKYYKGLGTSTSEEAKQYFANLDIHELKFGRISLDIASSDSSDGETPPVPDTAQSGTDLIEMVFSKKRVADRKAWLNAIKDDTYLDYSQAQTAGSVPYSDFINRELILFSKSDNMRSIPHFVDGFKPSQRKVLFACFKRKLVKEIKVAQLAGYVSEKSAYHHGEASLQGTIINMAQTFCGSNNVNLLTPSGQFGTRRMGGKDAASPRYIFTKLETVTRTIFHPDDDELLEYLSDDGMTIEPKFYMPVIPLVLVNGSDGIGTGWSSNVPNYCPREIIANVRRMIQGEAAVKMHPKYYGFTGEITEKAENSYLIRGKIERVDENTLLISELPIRKWTQDYKEFLETLLTGDGKKQEAELKDFAENHTDATVSFTITADPAKIDEFEQHKDGLYGKFKLSSTLSTANMNLFHTNGKITKFNSVDSILSSFRDIRLDYYSRRKALLAKNLGREKSILQNKARFVEEVCRGELVVSNRKRKVLLADLKERGFDLFPKEMKAGSDSNADNASNGDNQEDQEDQGDSAADADLAKGYEYLLGMKIWSLTFEKAEKLRQELAAKTKDLEDLEATEPSDIWLKDLDAIEAALQDRDETMKKAAERERQARDAAAEKRGKANGKTGTKRRARKKPATAKETSKPAPPSPTADASEKNNDKDDESPIISPPMVLPPATAGKKRKQSPAVDKDTEDGDSENDSDKVKK